MYIWYFLEAVKGTTYLQVMHIVRQLDSILQEEDRVFSAVAVHQGGEGWNLSMGPEASTTRPENIFTAGAIKQPLYTITSFTWSDATWLRNNEVYYCGASAPELESGMQPCGPSALPLLPAAGLARQTGESQKSNEGCLVWAPSLPIPPEILRILISQLSFIKGTCTINETWIQPN